MPIFSIIAFTVSVVLFISYRFFGENGERSDVLIGASVLCAFMGVAALLGQVP